MKLRDHRPFSWFWEENYGHKELNLGGFIVSFIGGVLLLFALVAAIVAAIAIPISNASCEQKGERLGIESNYRLLTGCYVQLPNGNWIPDNLYPPRYLNVEVGEQE